MIENIYDIHNDRKTANKKRFCMNRVFYSVMVE